MDHSSEAASIKKEPVKLSVLLNLSAIMLTYFVTRELKSCPGLGFLLALKTRLEGSQSFPLSLHSRWH